MGSRLRRALHVRPGEARRVLWLAMIGVTYAAASSLGTDIAESVFVARVGAARLPRLFLADGLVAVLAAAAYVRLARGRPPRAVWRTALASYAGAALAARALAAGGGQASAYALYVVHQCALTALTIHWGVFLLDAFDASQARRLFPLLFTATRLGGMVAGGVLMWLAPRVGAVDVLVAAAGFAAVAAALSLRPPAARSARPAAAGDADADTEPAPASGPARRDARGLWEGWRSAASSPLVRAIAVSTAAMVVVRHGLKIAAYAEFRAVYGDEDGVAAFLGGFAAWSNALGALIGVVVMPRVLLRLGVGLANLAYAALTLGACALLVVAPSLPAAMFGRLTHDQIKHAVKTPLSTLFYGAEPSARRALARAFVFGAVIPASRVASFAVFELAGRFGIVAVAGVGTGAAAVFVAATAIQNARWRRRLAELLAWKLERAGPPEPSLLRRARALLSGVRTADERSRRGRAMIEARRVRRRSGADEPSARAMKRPRAAALDDIARGLAAGEPRLRAVAEEVLAETIPRARAHAIAAALSEPGGEGAGRGSSAGEAGAPRGPGQERRR